MSDPFLTPPSPPTPAESSLIVRIFYHDANAPRLRGARAGWRAALFILLVLVLGMMANVGMRLAGMKPPTTSPVPPGTMGLFELASLLTVVAASLVMAWLEQRSWNEYGLPLRRAFRSSYWIGIPWGVGGLALLLGMMKLAGVFQFGHILLSGAEIVKYAVIWLAAFTLVGLFEEFFLRGYLLYTLSQGLGFWPAAVLLSVLFGAMHFGNKGEDIIGLISAGLIGLFFCFTLSRTGNLWFAVGMHAGWDWGESYLFGTADSGMVTQGRLAAPVSHGSHWLSGGSVGPEGSVLVLVAVALLFVAFHFAFPAKKRGETGGELASPV